jgi:inactive STAND
MKAIARKRQDLAAVERDLAIPQSQENEDRLKTRAEQLLDEIEADIATLAKYSIQDRRSEWEKNLYRIDHKQARTQIEKILKGFDVDDAWSALFLIQESDVYCGEYCIQHLRDQLEARGVLKHYHISLLPGDPPSSEDFVRHLGGKLQLEITSTLTQDIREIIDLLHSSSEGSSILFLEIHLDLVDPDVDFLKWLVQVFWCKLTSRCKLDMEIVGVVKIDNSLSSYELCCSDLNTPSDDHFLPLIQEKWKGDEIAQWLKQFGGFRNRSKPIAASILKIRQEELPNREFDPDRTKRKLLDGLSALTNSGGNP